MELINILKKFRDAEVDTDITCANWYTVAAAAMAAASAGPDVPKVYELATEGLSLEKKMLAQRRLKEAILKTSCLYGVPRSLQALLPLFATIPDNEIDHYGPRFETVHSVPAQQVREEKATKYFDTIWGEEAANVHRERNHKYQPDLYLLNLEMIYQWYFSEDTILNPIETQMCNASALICSNCPVQAMWHTRGIVRHSGTKNQAKFAQEIGLAIASLYDCKTGEIVPVDDIDIGSQSAE
ncbi:hypothetical protein EDB81DRAFT_883912 [Dactylonectria macrodidyma]|uniref:Uncharacterized protein n=1 Tax=Dactylonectria macrodidyma TaxID=307937 RepID=A0A9P9EVS4_9HYPO|nr:hypothetical protein EDB81DRAFT_883912 [Dactylonectria macrodidyma]